LIPPHERVRRYRGFPTVKTAVVFFRISFVSLGSAFSFRRRAVSSSRAFPLPVKAFIGSVSLRFISRIHRAGISRFMPRSWASPLPVCVPGRFHGTFLKFFRKNTSFSRDASFFEHRRTFLSFQAGEVQNLILKDQKLIFKDQIFIFEDQKFILKDQIFIFEDQIFIFEDQIFIFEDQKLILKDQIFIFEDQIFIFKDQIFIFKDQKLILKDQMLIFEDQIFIFEDQNFILNDQILIFDDQKEHN
jgi:hypothetical protein